MRRNLRVQFGILAVIYVVIVPSCVMAQTPPSPLDPAVVEAAMQAAFAKAPADWLPRLKGDETLQICSNSGNAPKPEIAAVISRRELARIQYPPDSKLLGDWRRAEVSAQSGYGLRFTDAKPGPPPARETGGNCYACHQLDPAEVSYGTIGPSLLGFGRARKPTDAELKAVYEKIYDSQASYPCSLMPRFGANGLLSIEQIKDLVALLMSADSPVNK